jgi:hypothetical protein
MRRIIPIILFPYPPNAVSVKRRIATNDRCAFGKSLRNDNAVKWVAVVQRQFL